MAALPSTYSRPTWRAAFPFLRPRLHNGKRMNGDHVRIGLALSGGGSRAIAFHLGCLRALNRLGLLERVAVLSTVSGGSVIGAYFHAHRGDFASFETKIRALL